MASFTATGDLVNNEPNLLPLADNRDSTLTHALRCSNAAVNAGVAGSTSSDQRGVAYGGVPDIGGMSINPCPFRQEPYWLVG